MQKNRFTIMKDKKQQSAMHDANKYPGIAIDKADDNTVDRKLSKEETKMLNDNPRGTETGKA